MSLELTSGSASPSKSSVGGGERVWFGAGEPVDCGMMLWPKELVGMKGLKLPDVVCGEMVVGRDGGFANGPASVPPVD